MPWPAGPEPGKDGHSSPPRLRRQRRLGPLCGGLACRPDARRRRLRKAHVALQHIGHVAEAGLPGFGRLGGGAIHGYLDPVPPQEYVARRELHADVGGQPQITSSRACFPPAAVRGAMRRTPDAIVVVGVDRHHPFSCEAFFLGGAGDRGFDGRRGQHFPARKVERMRSARGCGGRRAGRRPPGGMGEGMSIVEIHTHAGDVNFGQMRQDQSYKCGTTCPTYPLRRGL